MDGAVESGERASNEVLYSLFKNDKSKEFILLEIIRLNKSYLKINIRQ